MRVPAVVGSFPEPFVSGSEGRKLPVRLVCVGDAGDALRRGRDPAARRGGHGHGALRARAVRRARGAARARRPVGRGAARHRRAPARERPGRVRRVRQADAGRRPDRPARRRRAGRAHARPRRRPGRRDQHRGPAADLDRHRDRRGRRRRLGRGAVASRSCSTTSRSPSRRAAPCRCRWPTRGRPRDLPAAPEPAARRARLGRRDLVRHARARRALVRAPVVLGAAAGERARRRGRRPRRGAASRSPWPGACRSRW